MLSGRHFPEETPNNVNSIFEKGWGDRIDRFIAIEPKNQQTGLQSDNTIHYDFLSCNPGHTGFSQEKPYRSYLYTNK